MKGRLIVGGTVAGLAVALALVIIVWEYGIRRPSPPSLEDNPDARIPGELLYLDRSGCLERALASGASRSEVCLAGLDRLGPMAWVDERTVAFLTFPGSGPVLVAYDLVTGEEVDPPPGRPATHPGFGDAEAPNGDYVSTDEDGRVYVTSGITRTEIADFNTEGYRLRPVLWAPDSQWILLEYSPPRSPERTELWILSRDGSVRGTLAKGVRPFVYERVTWRIDGVGVTPDIVLE